jgi:hypothetical protein
LHEEGGSEGDGEAVAELGDTVGFVLAAAVGEENEGDIVRLEVGEGTVGTGEGLRASEEHAVDAGWCQLGSDVKKAARLLKGKGEVGSCLVGRGLFLEISLGLGVDMPASPQVTSLPLRGKQEACTTSSVEEVGHVRPRLTSRLANIGLDVRAEI